MSRRQSLRDAVRIASRPGSDLARALAGLVGCPTGGWPETVQAERRIIDELPPRAARTYTGPELVAKFLVVDHAGRYAWRD